MAASGAMTAHAHKAIFVIESRSPVKVLNAWLSRNDRRNRKPSTGSQRTRKPKRKLHKKDAFVLFNESQRSRRPSIVGSCARTGPMLGNIIYAPLESYKNESTTAVTSPVIAEPVIR